MSFVFKVPSHITLSTLRTSHLSRSFRPHIHPSTYAPPTTPASHTGASSMVVFHRSACESTTPSRQLNQPLHGPLSLKRVPEAHPQVPPSIQDAVSYRTRPTFASPLLSSLNGADWPFLRTICKAVLTIWSQFSEYEFDVILSALSPLQVPSFQAPMRATKSNLPHHKEGGASSPGPWVSGEATSRRNRVSDWGTVNVQRATLATRQAPSSL